jgi:hypothetical protein
LLVTRSLISFSGTTAITSLDSIVSGTVSSLRESGVRIRAACPYRIESPDACQVRKERTPEHVPKMAMCNSLHNPG